MTLLITLYIGNVILHSFGIFLLVKCHRSKNKIQYFFLGNLAASELMKNLVYTGYDILSIIKYQHNRFDRNFLNNVLVFLKCLSGTSVYYSYVLANVFITGDRIACVYYSARYSFIWTLYKSKVLLLSTWLFCLLTMIPVYLSDLKQPKKVIISGYVACMLNIMYLVFAVLSYTWIFSEYKKSKRRIKMSSTVEQLSTAQIFRQSRFYVAILILLSFLLFMVVPQFIIALMNLLSCKISENYDDYLCISETLSDTVDGIIYVFLQPKIRKMLLKNIRHMIGKFFQSENVVVPSSYVVRERII